MKFKFLKKAAAFVTATAMAMGTLAVLPEECLPEFGIVASAESIISYNNKISLGEYQSAYITPKGNLYMWGSNIPYDGTVERRNTPVKVTSNVSQVSLGEYQCAYVTTNGDLYTWGLNSNGQLGNGTTSASYTPSKIMSNVSQVSMGFRHSACITKNGDLYVWGKNDCGQLGDGTTTDKYTPVKIMSNVSQVSLGHNHSAYITTNGDLYTWGGNSYGQLGDGTTTDKYTPVKIMSNVSQVSLGCDQSACITTDNSLFTWGRNFFYNLGDGTDINKKTPQKIKDNVTQVSLGGGHGACITTNGDLYTWGNNFYGQLGVGNTLSYVETPTKIMSNVIQVDLGESHSACITANNELYTWGANANGVLGDGTSDKRLYPVHISIAETEETEPIEIDVQLLDKDNKPIDTIEYKRGEINLKHIRILVKNNSNKDYIVDDNSDEYLAVGICSIENQKKDSLINWIADSVAYKTDSLLRGQMQDYEIDVTTKSLTDELLTNELSFGFEFSYTDSNGIEESIMKYSKKCKVQSDVFNLINGDYNGKVNKKILTDYLYKDNKALDYFYKYNSSFDGGTCFGFSAVLSCLRNNNGMKKYFPSINSISDINENTVFVDNLTFRELIQIMHCSQATVDMVKMKSANKNNISGLINEIDNITPGDMNNIVIDVQKGTEAHALTPYSYYLDSNGLYYISLYDSNKPFSKDKIVVLPDLSGWTYKMGDDTWGGTLNTNINFITYRSGLLNDYMDIIQSADRKNKKVSLNCDKNGVIYSTMYISGNNINLETNNNSITLESGKITDEMIHNNIFPIIYDSVQNEEENINQFFLIPQNYSVTNNENEKYDIAYCLTDTAISANLSANAEITLCVSDDTPDDTYATVSGSSGDSISLCLEHDTLIDRDFTDIKFDGVMYDTLKIQETDDGMTVSGLKSGSFEITASDGTITAIVYSDNTGDVLIDDSANSSLSKISVDGEELSDFASDKTEYTVTLPYGTTAIPTVTATPANENADVDIAQATSLTGTEDERTAIITVTAEDGVTKTIYKVVFSIETHTHNLSTEYSSDDTGHWYECSDCDEKVDLEAHTEDSGTVTTEPTETNEGVKTFKCTKCEYVIRTEPIAVLDHTHSLATEYSSDETGHWYTCSFCDEKVDFEAHTEDSGTVTTEPTETTEGVKTFKCTKCDWVIRTEPITVLDHTHTLATEYSSDATGHWYDCSGCDEKIGYESHTEDSGTVTTVPTETTEGVKTFKCTKCKFVLRTEPISPITPDHIHNYDAEWKSDGTSHWHECSCGEKTEVAAHISNGGIVTVQPTETSEGIMTYSCSVCDYILRTETIPAIVPDHTHNYGAEWKSDSTSHWHECACGEKVDIAYHISDNGVVTLQPTETSEGIMTYSCSVCDYILRTESIPAIVPDHTHEYGTEWKSDSSTHWHECSCGDKTDIAQHVSNGGIVTVQPTATSTGLRVYSCSICGYVLRAETIPATGYNYPSYPTYHTYPFDSSIFNVVTFTDKVNVTAETEGNTVTIKWDKVEKADKYYVYQYKNGKYVTVKTTSDTSATFKKLKNGETYKFLIRYTKSGRLSPTKYSGTISVKVYYKPIPKPTATKNSIKLTWDAVPEAEKYAIYKYVDGKVVKFTETKKLSVKIGKLTPDTEYKYIVRAYVDGKWTTMLKSDIVTVKTKAE